VGAVSAAHTYLQHRRLSDTGLVLPCRTRCFFSVISIIFTFPTVVKVHEFFPPSPRQYFVAGIFKLYLFPFSPLFLLQAESHPFLVQSSSPFPKTLGRPIQISSPLSFSISLRRTPEDPYASFREAPETPSFFPLPDCRHRLTPRSSARFFFFRNDYESKVLSLLLRQPPFPSSSLVLCFASTTLIDNAFTPLGRKHHLAPHGTSTPPNLFPRFSIFALRQPLVQTFFPRDLPHKCSFFSPPQFLSNHSFFFSLESSPTNEHLRPDRQRTSFPLCFIFEAFFSASPGAFCYHQSCYVPSQDPFN